jgi:hypothetical protein
MIRIAGKLAEWEGEDSLAAGGLGHASLSAGHEGSHLVRLLPNVEL